MSKTAMDMIGVGRENKTRYANRDRAGSFLRNRFGLCDQSPKSLEHLINTGKG